MELMTVDLIAMHGGSRKAVPTSEYESLSTEYDKHIKKLKVLAIESKDINQRI